MERDTPYGDRTRDQSNRARMGQYYGRFYPTRLAKSLRSIDKYLMRWAMRKYKRLRGRRMRAWEFLAGVFAREPGLFAHWRVVKANDRTVGAV